LSDRIVINANINGEETEFLADERDSLLDALRERIGLTGREGRLQQRQLRRLRRDHGRPLVNSCCVLAAEIEGSEITTCEGIAMDGSLHPCSRLSSRSRLQCGICTPGFIVARRRCSTRTRTRASTRSASGSQETSAAVRLRQDYSPRFNARVNDPELEVDYGRNERYKVIGTRPIRPDGTDKVTGRAQYGADIHLTGMLYGRVSGAPTPMPSSSGSTRRRRRSFRA